MTLCTPTTVHMGAGGHTQDLLALPFVFPSMEICSFYTGQNNLNGTHFPTFIADISVLCVSVLEG